MTDSSAAQGTGVPRRILFVLGALSAFGPLSTDMYLPALPALARSLGTSSSIAQLTLSLSLVGLGVGQLFAGPISDAMGRRAPLIFGLLAYILASVVCALSSSIVLLLLMRVIQGLAGAFGIAIGRAVVRDRCSGLAAARAFTTLMLVGGLGPILAPVAGGLLLHITDWRGIFFTGAIIGVVTLAFALWLIPESLPVEQRSSGGIAAVLDGFSILLRDRRYLGHNVCGGLAFGALAAYISGSPFLLERIHGLSPEQYSLVFAGNGAGIMLSRQISSRALATISPSRMTAIALAGQATAAVGVLLTIVLGLGLAPLLVCLFVAAASFGTISPMTTVLVMEDHPERAGSASGLYGFVMFTIGSIVAPIVGIGGPLDAIPIAIVMPACSICASLAFVSAQRWRAAVAVLR